MTLQEARKKARPGDYIMMLPSASRYGEPRTYIVASAEQREKLSAGWVTWERVWES